MRVHGLLRSNNITESIHVNYSYLIRTGIVRLDTRLRNFVRLCVLIASSECLHVISDKFATVSLKYLTLNTLFPAQLNKTIRLLNRSFRLICQSQYRQLFLDEL